MKTLLILLLLIMAQVGHAEDADVVFAAGTPQTEDDVLVFTNAVAEEDIAVRMKDAITDGEAEVTAEGLVSFFNSRIDHEFEQRKRDLLTAVREDLLKSNELFLCVDNFLSGYAEAPLEGDRTQLDRTVEPVVLLDDEPVEIDENGSVSKFVRIKYNDTDYWVKESILNKSSGVMDSYVTKFSDCSKIQSDIEENKIEEALAAEVAARPPRGSRFKYVCTQESGKIGGHTTKDLNRDTELRDGSEVAILQGSSSAPFETEEGVTYIRVKYERAAYWVAQDYIKAYEDCPKIHTEAVEVCNEGSLNYYETDAEIAGGNPVGQFGSFSGVYKFMGNIYSKKVVLNSAGDEITYVPVKKTQDAEEIYWVAERYVPQTCGINPEAQITFRGKHNSCTVRRNDNFPLPVAAQFNYYTDSARFGAGRGGGRMHAATDLYSYTRGSSRSNNTWGRIIRAVDDGKVVSIAGYGGIRGGTQRITVQSKFGYTWNYAEVGRVQVRLNQWIKKGNHLATARKYANGTSYPAMLHLEKYNAKITNPRGGRQNNRYKRNSSITNPSCHVEYMENKKFGTRR